MPREQYRTFFIPFWREIELGRGPTLRSGDNTLCNQVSKQKMNPAEQVPRKDNEFELNAPFGSLPRIPTDETQASRATPAPIIRSRLVNHDRKGLRICRRAPTTSAKSAKRRTGMALKVELKPHERIIIGACVVTNTDQRASLLIDGDRSPILFEKDIQMTETADTPAQL